MADYDPSRDPAPKGQGKHQAILEAAREEARRDEQYWRESYAVEEEDQRFLCGAQWDPIQKQARTDAGLVTLTINDLGQFLDQVTGDMRQNPTQIKITPSDFGATMQKFVSVNGRKYQAHEVIAGLIRDIEFRCKAPMHYVLAGQHAAETGRGWLRLRSDYRNDKAFVQDLIIERVKNRWSVLPDSMATQPDYSDMMHCMVGCWEPLDKFRREHPKASMAPIGEVSPGYWDKPDFVRLSERYWRKPVTIRRLLLDNGVTIDDTDERLFAAAEVSGRVISERKVRTFEVWWAKMTYHDVIDEPRKLPGTRIPLVPVLGKVIEGREDDFTYGLFRFGKEPKMMENYWLSSATQRMSQMPNAPWVVTDTMVEMHKNAWREANRGAPAYLPYTPDPAAPMGPQRVPGASIPAGEMQLLLAFGDKVKAAVGFHDAAIGKTRNDQSGIAIERLQQESDVGSFVFTDNLRMAIGSIGQIAVDWIPSVYDTERFVSIRHASGEVDLIQLNTIDEATGEIVNDITGGNFDALAETGPAYSTLRQQGADMGMRMVEGLAQVGQGEKVSAIVDIVAENMDFPSSDRIAKRLRKMVPPQLIDETEMTDEERAAGQPPPSPDQVLAMKNAEAAGLKADAEIAKANAMHDTADATRAKARADVATATTQMAQAITGAAQVASGASEKSGESEGKPKGKIDPEMKAALEEMILQTLATALADMAPETNSPAPAPIPAVTGA